MGTEGVGGEVNAGAGSEDSAQPARTSCGCGLLGRAAAGKGGCLYRSEGSHSPGHKEPSPRARSARWAATHGIRAAGAQKGGLAVEARARRAKVGCGNTANTWHKEPQRRRVP